MSLRLRRRRMNSEIACLSRLLSARAPRTPTPCVVTRVESTYAIFADGEIYCVTAMALADISLKRLPRGRRAPGEISLPLDDFRRDSPAKRLMNSTGPGRDSHLGGPRRSTAAPPPFMMATDD